MTCRFLSVEVKKISNYRSFSASPTWILPKLYGLVAKRSHLARLCLLAIIASPNSPAWAVGVDFIQPPNLAKVSKLFDIKFSVSGMEVAPAGPIREGTGHYHLLIDIDQGIPKGDPFYKDANHLDFVRGQTETKLVLNRGKHYLTLQFADGVHRSYGVEYAKTIQIEVK